MSVMDRLRNLFSHRPADVPTEDDVQPDTGVARTRVTGGTGADVGDAPTTTGGGPSAGFVGRVSGDDLGGAEESGAEARAEAAQDPTRDDRMR